MLQSRPRIIDVERKPTKCPKCGGQVLDIIYGTGDMTEIEFLFTYRRQAMMGGDNIPRRPPIWECECGCKRFRKVNPDGTDAPVKPKLLENIRKGSLEKFHLSATDASCLPGSSDVPRHHYKVKFTTDCGETETVNVAATSEVYARQEVRQMVYTGVFGHKGRCVDDMVVTEEE